MKISIVAEEAPMNPKMYFIVGTRMTRTLLSAITMAAITKCLIQLKGLLGNNSVITDVRIGNRTMGTVNVTATKTARRTMRRGVSNVYTSL